MVRQKQPASGIIILSKTKKNHTMPVSNATVGKSCAGRSHGYHGTEGTLNSDDGFTEVGADGRPKKESAAGGAQKKKTSAGGARGGRKVFKPSTKGGAAAASGGNRSAAAASGGNRGAAAASGGNGGDPPKKKECPKCKPGLKCAECAAKAQHRKETRKKTQGANRKGKAVKAPAEAAAAPAKAPAKAAAPAKAPAKAAAKGTGVVAPAKAAAPAPAKAEAKAPAQDGKGTGVVAAVLTFAMMTSASVPVGAGAAAAVVAGAAAAVVAGAAAKAVFTKKKKVKIEDACGQTFACKVVKKLDGGKLGFVVSSAFHGQLFCLNMEEVAKGEEVQVKIQKNKPAEVEKGKSPFIGRVVPKPHPLGVGFDGTIVKSTHTSGQNHYGIKSKNGLVRMMCFHGNDAWLFNVGDRVRFDVVERNGEPVAVPVDGSAYKPHRTMGSCTGIIINDADDGSWWIETTEGRIVAPGDDPSNIGVVRTDGSLTKPTEGMPVTFDVTKGKYGSQEINIARNLNEVGAAPFKDFECVHLNLKNGRKCKTVGPSYEVNTDGDLDGRMMCTKCTKMFGVKSCESCHHQGCDLVSVNKKEFTERTFTQKSKKWQASMSVCTKCFDEFRAEMYVPCSSAWCKAKRAESPNDLNLLHRPDKMKAQFQTADLYCTDCACWKRECHNCDNVVSAVTGGCEHNGVFYCKLCLAEDTTTSAEGDVVNDCWQFVEPKKGQKGRKADRKARKAAAEAAEAAEAAKADALKTDVPQWTPPSQKEIDYQNDVVNGLQSQLSEPVKQMSPEEKAAEKRNKKAKKTYDKNAARLGHKKVTRLNEENDDEVDNDFDLERAKDKAMKKEDFCGPKHGKGAWKFQTHNHTRVNRKMKINWYSWRAIIESLMSNGVPCTVWFVRCLQVLFAFHDAARLTTLNSKIKGFKDEHADKLAKIKVLIKAAKKADLVAEEDMAKMLDLEKELQKLDDVIQKKQLKLEEIAREIDSEKIRLFVEDYLEGKFDDEEKTIAAAHEAQLQSYKESAIRNQFTLALGKCSSPEVLAWIHEKMDLTTDVNGLMSEFTALINLGNIEQAYADAMELDEEWKKQCEEEQRRHEKEQEEQRRYEEEQRRREEEQRRREEERKKVLEKSLMPKFAVPTTTTVPTTVEVVVVNEPTPPKAVAGFTFPKLDRTKISLGRRTARAC